MQSEPMEATLKPDEKQKKKRRSHDRGSRSDCAKSSRAGLGRARVLLVPSSSGKYVCVLAPEERFLFPQRSFRNTSQKGSTSPQPLSVTRPPKAGSEKLSFPVST